MALVLQQYSKSIVLGLVRYERILRHLHCEGILAYLSFTGTPLEQAANNTLCQLKQEYLKTNHEQPPDKPSNLTSSKATFPLLPAAELKSIIQRKASHASDSLWEPAEIQRPNSALHAGDFTTEAADDNTAIPAFLDTSRPSSHVFPDGPLKASPTSPWYTPSRSLQVSNSGVDITPSETYPDTSDRRPWRSRAPSLTSYSSSNYVLKAPTTPLVQQSNNTDLDFSARTTSTSPEKPNRRHTLPPHDYHGVLNSTNIQSPISALPVRHPPSFRRDHTFPYGHHPRRSLNSNWSLQPSTSPQTPAYLRSRRTSFSSETSPLQRAHMVGSYEESILRGWMSTAPSRPLDFTAQIGVLGRGNCKPKYPAHITVPFPAVFYSYGTGNGRSIASDDPSPYVGHIDLQNSLDLKKPRERPDGGSETDIEPPDTPREHGTTIANFASKKHNKRQRTSSSNAPPGGSYRIPQQGQLQIIIKNPNKTAVKLFLVPYDLESMEPGTKTFIRQRSYFADAVMDSPIAPSDLSPTSVKPTLRYLIHLNICSPQKGRFYLYHQIRVVFANRVPDNKEQLRNEIQLPQPRFSAYKPNYDSLSGAGSSAGAKLTAEKAFRRRSSGFSFGISDLEEPLRHTFAGGSSSPFDDGPAVPPIPAIPFDIVSRQKPSKASAEGESGGIDIDDLSRPTTPSDLQSLPSNKANSFRGVQLSSSHLSISSEGSDGYSKLSKGDVGYGGLPGRPGTPEPGEGLLARKLKGMGCRKMSMNQKECI